MINEQQINSEDVKKNNAIQSQTVWWKHLLAGGIAGITAKTITAPLDRLKIFAQVKSKRKYRMGQEILHMVNDGGINSLWRGNGVAVLKVGPESATKFLCYDQAKRFLKDKQHELTNLEKFLCGAFAGCISQSVIYPLDVVKTTLCLRRSNECKSVKNIATSGYTKYGLKFFFRGYVTSVIGMIFLAGIDLSLYERLKQYSLERRMKGIKSQLEWPPESLILLFCGMSSSSIAQIITYPLSVITVTLQAHERLTTMPLRKSIIFVIKKKLKMVGVIAFYRGMTASLLRGVPSIGITYVVYENTLKRLGTEMS